jgi:hypothetical protein
MEFNSGLHYTTYVITNTSVIQIVLYVITHTHTHTHRGCILTENIADHWCCIVMSSLNRNVFDGNYDDDDDDDDDDVLQ